MSLLKMEGIKKSFNRIEVLHGIDLEVKSGEIVALLGENGAGKSTLMKILAGVHLPSEGKIFMEAKEVTIDSPRASQQLRISIIHQEFNLLKDLSVAENIFLGKHITTKLGVINWKEMNEETTKLLKRVGIGHISPSRLVSECSIAERQLIEIAKALSFESKVLIMDEPTATLNNEDTQKLLSLMEELREEGLGIIFITHRMDEVMSVADRAVVMRDGAYIGQEEVENLTKDQIVRMLVGRDLTNMYPDRVAPQDEVVMEVNQLHISKRLHDISFTVKKGEVLGIGGLLGSGKTDLSKALFGLLKHSSGEVKMLGQKVSTPRGAIDAGIALVTDDRKDEGLVLDLSVAENILIPSYRKISNFGVLKKNTMSKIVDRWVSGLQIKTPSAESEVRKLSGGNQQKVVLGKWLQMDPKILILNEPTRGIDIGAKFEIYKIIHELAAKGIAIILISSEMPELLGMSHRIIVMNEGRLSGEMDITEATQEKIFEYATGGE
ncbi:sugar ABC transporter ATP-binding protein [Sutcliffiella rhizosphaerae]|uniref:Ribose import ATP-binding protein RbsA n=1 Tax=Sutcliffiella rhizosphaerae TaxID=2880967 RepID=A0ABM8YMG7_9BACI|nr:Ribose import ATP-binding protein RbsA [Sutcliffiella rhizosphaerae]